MLRNWVNRKFHLLLTYSIQGLTNSTARRPGQMLLFGRASGFKLLLCIILSRTSENQGLGDDFT